METIFRKDTQASFQQGLCLTAKKIETNEVVGFLFCQQCDFMLTADDEKPPMGCPLRHSYDGGEALYLRAARNTTLGLAHVARGETLRVVAGVTVAGYEGKGIGTLLRLHLQDFIRSRGFCRILVEAISPATVHIWKKANYMLRAGRLYWSPWFQAFPRQCTGEYRNGHSLGHCGSY